MNSRQLDLHPPGADGWGANPPWKGQSPRVLTKAFETFRFRPEGMGRLDQDASHVGEITQSSSNQLELFLLISGV